MAYKDKARAVKYQNEYNKVNYDRITIMLDKGDKERLKAAAAARGLSVNELVKQAIKYYAGDNN